VEVSFFGFFHGVRGNEADPSLFELGTGLLEEVLPAA
jgi:hypothetical protein